MTEMDKDSLRGAMWSEDQIANISATSAFPLEYNRIATPSAHNKEAREWQALHLREIVRRREVEAHVLKWKVVTAFAIITALTVYITT